ncbi:MAG: hypothetical protein JRI47_09570 [Deltaproteobacteria bacterium]|nr:hypothetical protein [Deltaproteobacteria bacterium]
MKSAKKSPAKKAAAKKTTGKKAALRKASAKKKVVKKAPAKKTMTKKTSAKKTTALTATDQVLKIIRRFKKGVDVPTLVQKTGLAPTTVRNVVSRAKKQGKIKRVDRGVYAGA